MKMLYLILITGILLASCKKEHEDKFLTSIKTGQTDGIGIKYVDFELDEKLVYNDAGYLEFLKLDLNSDSIDDFELCLTLDA
jgi:hypothetical protein